MRLSLFWKLVIGFGTLLVAVVIINSYLLARLDDRYSAATTRIAQHTAAIRTAQDLHALLESELRYIRLCIAVPDQRYILLRGEAHRMSRVRTDSLALYLHADDQRRILTSFRQVHESLADLVSARPRPPAIDTAALTDSLAILHEHLDRIIQMNQQGIAIAVAGLDRDAAPNPGPTFWLLLSALAAIVAAAFFVAGTVTRPLDRLRNTTEQIAHGNYRSVSIHRNDEMGMIAQSLNRIASKLRRAEQHKAEMAQQISRELQTPLQAMHAAYYALAEQIAGSLNERQMHLVTTIRDNIDVVTAFSNQFLDLARIETGTMRYHKQAVELLPLVTPLINSARLAAASKGVSIGLAVQSVPPVRIDLKRITTVLTTLLNNAVSFTPRGGTVTVTITPCPNGARVAVKDAGAGIATDELPEVFAASFQMKDASAEVRGVGMGLALVKAIVDGHGGRVYATSAPGEGSTFTVELPAETVRPLPHPPQPN